MVFWDRLKLDAFVEFFDGDDDDPVQSAADHMEQMLRQRSTRK